MNDTELRLACLSMVLGDSAVPSDLTAVLAQATQIYNFINVTSVDAIAAPIDVSVEAVAQPASE